MKSVGDPYIPLTSHIHLGELKDTKNIYYLSSRFCPMSYYLGSPKVLECSMAFFLPTSAINVLENIWKRK